MSTSDRLSNRMLVIIQFRMIKWLVDMILKLPSN